MALLKTIRWLIYKAEYINNSDSVPTNGPVCSDKKTKFFTNGLVYFYAPAAESLLYSFRSLTPLWGVREVSG